MGRRKGSHHTEKIKKQISNSLTGRTGLISLAGRKKLSEIHKGDKNPMSHITEEERKKCAERASGNNSPYRRFLGSELRKQHDDLVDSRAKLLEKQGYRVAIVGKWKNPLPDIIAFKDGKMIAYEISSRAFPNEEKWKDNSPYDDVIWICFKKVRISEKVVRKNFEELN